MNTEMTQAEKWAELKIKVAECKAAHEDILVFLSKEFKLPPRKEG